MKKYIYLFSASLLLLISCSNEDDKTDPLATILVRKSVFTDFNGREDTSTFVYNGNKIVSVSSNNGDKSIYTYTGDLITKIVDTNNDTLVSTSEYTYLSGKLSSFVFKRVGLDFYRKTVYTHNADGSVFFQSTIFNMITGEEDLGLGILMGKYIFSEGNLIKKVSGSSIEKFEYDTKNNPFKNIMGLSLLLDRDEKISKNNVLRVDAEYDSSYGGAVSKFYVYSYTYAENNFPVKDVWSSAYYTSTREYFY